jgi:hypothetical protein
LAVGFGGFAVGIALLLGEGAVGVLGLDFKVSGGILR